MKRTVALLCLVVLAAAAQAGAQVGASPRAKSYVVTSSATAQAAAAVADAGGVVTSEIELIQAVVANLKPHAVRQLRQDARVHSVTRNYKLELQSASFEQGPVSTYRESTAANGSGADGSGVGVALLDTGVAEHPDLRGQVAASVDLTNEVNFTDTYGHGTFMAGLIVGTGASSGGAYTGMAPGAHLVSVKVSGADGTMTLGQVLYGLQLIDASKDIYNIRVVALALSSPPLHGPDPLVLAVERLWADGIFVVAAAGNSGPVAGSVTSPGVDPYVLTMGASDEAGTASTDDDSVPAWSARGPSVYGMAKPDMVAPGVSLVSLRSPGSTIDTANPGARIGSGYFKGSGTSMSTAVAAGAAALLISEDPSLSPDMVKGRLMGGAVPVGDPGSAGAGLLDVSSALASGAGPANAGLPSLPAGAQVQVPQDPHPGAKGSTFTWVPGNGGPDRWEGRGWGGRGWGGRGWGSSDWSGRGWAASDWAGRGWAGRGWAGQMWSNGDWSGRGWAGGTWAAASWR